MRKIIFIIVTFINVFHLNAQLATHDSSVKEDTLGNVQNTLFNILTQGTQSEDEIPKIIPPSPQAQIFQKYVDHKITEYNGLPEIAIPLYELEIKGMKIPIILSYHASGVKYKQFDGELGAGWSIQVGGYRVSRTIYGKADEQCNMYNATTLNSYLQQSPNYNRDAYLGNIGLYITEGYADHNLHIGVDPSRGTGRITNDGINGYLDGEYDQFTYNLPTTNGHFIISDRNNWNVTITEGHQDKIEMSVNTSVLSGRNIKNIAGFNITDNMGYKYDFGGISNGMAAIEAVETVDIDSYKNTSWLLTQIESPYKEIVNFDYLQYCPLLSRELNTTFTISETEIVKDEIMGLLCPRIERQPIIPTMRTNIPDGKYKYPGIKYLNKIETNDLIIRFVRGDIFSYDSDGINSFRGGHVLQHILIEDYQGNIIKKIAFNYKSSPESSAVIFGETPWHRLLTSVTIGTNNQSEQKYSFEYYEPISSQACYYPDQWGYYVAQNKPGLAYYNRLHLHDEFKQDVVISSTDPVPLTNTVNYWFGSTLPFVKRSENTVTPNVFSLKKIIYPTGGFTEYEYEPHQHKYGNKIVKGGGQRINKISSLTAPGEKALTTVYKYGANEDGNGVANLDYISFSKSFSQESNFISFRSTLYERCGFEQFNVLTASKMYSNKPLLEDVESFYRIAYNEVATYQYNPEETIHNGRTVSKYHTPSPVSFNSMSSQTTGLSFSNYFGYSQVSNEAGKLYVGEYRLGDIPLIESQTIYHADGRTVEKTEYTYIPSSTQIFNGIKIKQKISFDRYLPKPTNIAPLNTYGIIRSYFDYGYTKYITGTKLLASKKTTHYVTQYSQQKEISTQDFFIYDNKNQLIETQKNTSTNGLSKEFFKYPYNYSGYIYSDMMNENSIARVIEQYTVINGNETKRRKTNFMKQNNMILPSSVEISNGGSAKTIIAYNVYSNSGKLLECTLKNGVKIAYLWGYNELYPVAEVQNATYQQVKDAMGTTFMNRLTQQNWPTNNDLNQLNNLRSLFPNALVSTYTYKPFVGKTSETNPDGITTYYEYDVFGRLIYIKDNDGKVISAYQYEIKNK